MQQLPDTVVSIRTAQRLSEGVRCRCPVRRPVLLQDGRRLHGGMLDGRMNWSGSGGGVGTGDGGDCGDDDCVGGSDSGSSVVLHPNAHPSRFLTVTKY